MMSQSSSLLQRIISVISVGRSDPSLSTMTDQSLIRAMVLTGDATDYWSALAKADPTATGPDQFGDCSIPISCAKCARR